MDITKKFGRRILQLRTEQGWSQEELADQADLHRTYISGLERGVKNPTIKVILKLAKAFSISPSEMLDMED